MEYRILCRPSYSLLELKLRDGEEVLAEAGAMVYMRNVELKTEVRGGILGGLKRALLGGETFFVNRYVARGEGLLGLAPKYNGDIVHIPPKRKAVRSKRCLLGLDFRNRGGYKVGRGQDVLRRRGAVSTKARR